MFPSVQLTLSIEQMKKSKIDAGATVMAQVYFANAVRLMKISNLKEIVIITATDTFTQRHGKRTHRRHFSWVNVNDPAIVLGLKTWSDKLTAGENIKKKENEKQYVGVQFRNKTPKKKVAGQSIFVASAQERELKTK
ncbi:MAG: hypothetical protein LBU87_04015 [Lactobacillales bacterium]|jgi:hypothetical protein|nr:hypothetical protein [Lactobacillales bacterium]